MSQLVDADLLRQPLLLPFIHVVCADTHIRPLFSHIATPGPPSPTQAPVRTPASGPFGPFPSAPYSPGHEGPVRTIYGLPPGQHSRRKSGTTTPLDPGLTGLPPGIHLKVAQPAPSRPQHLSAGNRCRCEWGLCRALAGWSCVGRGWSCVGRGWSCVGTGWSFVGRGWSFVGSLGGACTL
jgi:hypothetical protein